MLRAILLSLVLLVSAADAWAAAGPTATAAEIRAQRATEDGQWRLTYDLRDDQGVSSRLTLAIGPDYVLRQDDNGIRIADFALNRVYTVAADGRRFDNNSLHADVAFRIHELQNRKALGRVLDGAKIDKLPPHLDSFWAECELSMGFPNQLPYMVRRDRGALVMAHGDAVAVRAVLGREDAPAAVRARLSRLWRHGFPLHPQMARELGESGRAPDSLEVRGAGTPGLVRRTLTLVKSEWVERADFPLPADAEIASDTGAPNTVAMLAAARAAVRHQVAAPPLETYLERMRDSLGRGARLEATLWGMEALLTGQTDLARRCPTPEQRGEPCDTLRRALQAGLHDPRAQTILGRGALKAETPVPDLSDLRDAHVGRLLMSTRLVMGGAFGAKVEDGYRAALDAAPGVAGYYKDIGDYYQRIYQHATGWKFYDLGRQLPGGRDHPLLRDVDGFEAKIRRDFPELY